MTADRREIYRYLGCRSARPPEELRRTVEDCLAELEATVAPRRIYRLYLLDEVEEKKVRFGGLTLESRDLASFLKEWHHDGPAGRHTGAVGGYLYPPTGKAGDEPGGRSRCLRFRTGRSAGRRMPAGSGGSGWACRSGTVQSRIRGSAAGYTEDAA